MRRTALLIGLAGVGLASAPPSPATAAFPGRNGVIAYEYPDPDPSYDEAYLDYVTPGGQSLPWDGDLSREGDAPAFSPDGRRLAYGGAGRFGGIVFTSVPPGREHTVSRPHNDFGDYDPSWSPNGRAIAFDSAPPRESLPGRWIYTVRVNGTGRRALGPGWDPAWSARGMIAFEGNLDDQIHVMNADGRDVRVVTSGRGAHLAPNWSPDGRRIVFTGRDGLFTVGAGGGLPRRLTSGNDGEPAFSPDGKRVVFERGNGLYIISARGGRARALPCAHRDEGCERPDWQPLPVRP